MTFAGDCTFGEDDSYTWNTFTEVYKKVNDPAYFFSGVSEAFRNDDYTFINLEGPLTTHNVKEVDKEYEFKGSPEFVRILPAGSVEGVTLANNHSMDYSQKGFDDTVKVLNENGIDYVYFEKDCIREIKGIKIGMLGYKRFDYNQELRAKKLIKEQVKAMREAGVDFIVANFHWGREREYWPTDVQKQLAHFAIDNGVDLVIGHHPHVMQGMEVYKGKNIMYSLGNFCFGGSPAMYQKDKDTIVYQHALNLDVSNPDDVKIASQEYVVLPARVTSATDRNNYKPIIVDGSEGERILKKFRGYTVK